MLDTPTYSIKPYLLVSFKVLPGGCEEVVGVVVSADGEFVVGGEFDDIVVEGAAVKRKRIHIVC